MRTFHILWKIKNVPNHQADYSFQNHLPREMAASPGPIGPMSGQTQSPLAPTAHVNFLQLPMLSHPITFHIEMIIRRYGVPKSPWVSILSHGLSLIGGTSMTLETIIQPRPYTSPETSNYVN